MTNCLPHFSGDHLYSILSLTSENWERYLAQIQMESNYASHLVVVFWNAKILGITWARIVRLVMISYTAYVNFDVCCDTFWLRVKEARKVFNKYIIVIVLNIWYVGYSNNTTQLQSDFFLVELTASLFSASKNKMCELALVAKIVDGVADCLISTLRTIKK